MREVKELVFEASKPIRRTGTCTWTLCSSSTAQEPWFLNAAPIHSKGTIATLNSSSGTSNWEHSDTVVSWQLVPSLPCDNSNASEQGSSLKNHPNRPNHLDPEWSSWRLACGFCLPNSFWFLVTITKVELVFFEEEGLRARCLVLLTIFCRTAGEAPFWQECPVASGVLHLVVIVRYTKF